jgi:hypothetical protein
MTVSMNSSLHVRGNVQEAVTARCWRCLNNPVPQDDDHIGLCDRCLAILRDPPSLFDEAPDPPR